jgi:hypothetical protein
MASFEENLPRLSLQDVKSVQLAVRTELSQPPTLFQVIEGAKAVKLDMVDSIVPGYQQLGKGAPNDTDKSLISIADNVAKLGPEQRRQLTERLRQVIADTHDNLAARLKGPESQWYSGWGNWFASLPPASISDGSVDGIAYSLAHEMVPSFRTLINSNLRSRAQLRILGLHAAVIAFRWVNHRLPHTLAEAVPPADLFDPLSNADFQFQAQNGGTYRIFSNGNSDTGIVELRYQRGAVTKSQKAP